MSDEQPVDNSVPSVPPDDSESARRQTEEDVERIAQSYLANLRSGGADDAAELVTRYPQLAPHLQSRLQLYAAILRVTQMKSDPHGLPASGSAMGADEQPKKAGHPTTRTNAERYNSSPRVVAERIRCPHCGNRVQLVDESKPEVKCDSCGSEIRVDLNATKIEVHSIDQFNRPMPKQLGRFRIIRPLGEGGFGTVYLAKDSQLNRYVAVKVPRNGYFASAEEEQRFLREAQNTARLRHPNIVQVHEISEDQGTPFIVSEFIDGLTLRDLTSAGQQGQRELATLMIQIASAVHYAHQHGIVHRDLKPSNILLDRQQNPYVADFGLARYDDAEITMTMDGVLLGTPAYMAPEQAAGIQREVSTRSDVYSLGVILYQLLCRELPFHGSKRMLIQQVIHDDPKSPKRLNPSIPSDLETITLKAMSKKPSQRYQSAEEFAEELRRWLRGDPILARPIGQLDRFGRWCKKHPTIASLGCIIGLLLVLGIAATSVWAVRENQLRVIANDQKLEVIKNQQLSETRQYEVLSLGGADALEENHLAKAGLWYAEALGLRDTNSNRIRIGMIQDQLPALTNLFAVSDRIDELAFSNDGSRIAIGSHRGKIAVANLSGNRIVFEKQTSPFSELHFSSDGSKVVLSGADNFVHLWDVEEKTPEQLLAHTALVLKTDIDATGQWIASGCVDSHARLWSADGSKRIERKFENLRVSRVQFVPETELLALVTQASDGFESELQLWDFQKDVIVAQKMTATGPFSHVAFSDDAKTAVTVTIGGDILQWNLTSQLSTTPLPMNYRSKFVMFRNGNRDLITVSPNAEVDVWNVQGRRREGTSFRGRVGLANVAVDPQRRLIAMGYVDGTVEVYWIENGQPACTSLQNGESVSALAFHPDGKRLAVGGSHGILQVWDLPSSTPRGFVLEHQDDVRNAVFLPDGKRCVTIGRDGQGFIWDTETGRHVGEALVHTAPLQAVSFTSQGKQIITGAEDGSVSVWDGFSGQRIGQQLLPYEEKNSAVMVIAASPNDQLFTVGYADGKIRTWSLSDIHSEKPSPRFLCDQHDKIQGLAYSPTGQLIATSSKNGSVMCWNAATGVLEIGPLEHSHATGPIRFLNNGAQLLTSCGDSISIWDLKNASIAHVLKCGSSILGLKVLSDGKRIVTCELGERTRVWQLVEGRYQQETAIIHPAIESAHLADASRDESILVVAGGTAGREGAEQRSGAAILWDLLEHSPLGPPLKHLAEVRSARFAANNGKILTCSPDRTARLFPIPRCDLTPLQLKRLFGLLSQIEFADGRRRMMSPEKQIAEFNALAPLFPEFFSTAAGDAERWEHEADRIHTQISVSAHRESTPLR